MSARSLFFFSTLFPSVSFLFRVVLRLFGVNGNFGFSVVSAKIDKSSGATFSKIQLALYKEGGLGNFGFADWPLSRSVFRCSHN